MALWPLATTVWDLLGLATGQTWRVAAAGVCALILAAGVVGVNRKRTAPVRLLWLILAAWALAAGAVAAMTALAWLVLDTPQWKPPGEITPRNLDAIATRAFAIVAGLGGVALLVIAYRRQRTTETGEEREVSKLFTDTFDSASDKLGSEHAAVRLAGVHALARLADEAPEGRNDLVQMIIDVLCAYLRMPYAPEPGELPQGADNDQCEDHRARTLEFASLREVRRTIIRVIGNRLRENSRWRGKDYDFTGVVFDSGNFSKAHFTGGKVSFSGARFTEGTADFSRAEFTGGKVDFTEVEITKGKVDFSWASFVGGVVDFSGAELASREVSFVKANFSGGKVLFNGVKFADGEVFFGGVRFTGGKVFFNRAEFDGEKVSFSGAEFAGGTVDFADAKFAKGKVSFVKANFSGSRVPFRKAKFVGATVDFAEAKFVDGTVLFSGASFADGEVFFGGVRFTGGKVSFSRAKFVGGVVNFGGAEFAGGEVSFGVAEFVGGEVSFVKTDFAGGEVDFHKAKFPGGKVDFRYAFGPHPRGLMEAIKNGKIGVVVLPKRWQSDTDQNGGQEGSRTSADTPDY